MLGDSVKRRARAVRTKAKKPRTPEEGARQRRILMGVGALLLPFVIGYIIAVLLLFPPPDVAAQGTGVPSLIGMSLDEARSAVTNAGLGSIDVTELPHPDAAEGTVTAQSPLAGQQLRDGAPVRVAVSAGVPRVRVPNVADFPADRAAALLTRLGFRVQRNDEASDEEAGRVIRQDPEPGVLVAVPARVVIWVSSGRPALEEPADTGSASIARNLRPDGRLPGWTDPPGGPTFEQVLLPRSAAEGRRP